MRSATITTGETIYSGNVNAIRSDARGAASLHAHQQLGALALATNPSNTQTLTLTINGTAIVIHFVTSIGATANNVLIGSSALITSQNLYNFLTNPSITNTTQVGATAANQTLLSYLCFGLNTVSVVTTIGSMNRTIYAPLTSFTCSTTATSGSYTASTMKLYIEPGVCWVNGTEVYFPGGSTPAVTAPSANPRIDVLSIDSSGTLAWTTGSENASPVAPTYPSNKLPICELYNVVSETILNDTDNQASGTGYILNDVRPILQNGIVYSAIPDALIPAAADTYDLGSSSKEWNNLYVKTVTINGALLNPSNFDVFGDGSDGDINVNSGSFSSGPITSNALTRDAYFHNLTLSGGNLNTNGFRCFVQNILTENATFGFVSNGGAGGAGAGGTSSAGGAVGGTAGSAAHSAGSVAASLSGKAGGNGSQGSGIGNSPSAAGGVSGTGGDSTTNSLTAAAGVSGGSGGAGGNSSTGQGGGAGGGGGGSASAPTYGMHTLLDFLRFLEPSNATWSSFSQYAGSGGGGSGGGAASGGHATNGGGFSDFGGGGGAGGGSGAAGGNIVIIAYAVVHNGSNQAKGGAGGAGGAGQDGGDGGSGGGGAGGGGSGGGGAGGAGGLIYILYHSYTGAGTNLVTGGAAGLGSTYVSNPAPTRGGAHGAAGSNGTAGASGLALLIQI